MDDAEGRWWSYRVTADNPPPSQNTSGTLPSVANPTCPGANGLNYTSTATTAAGTVFRMLCDTTFSSPQGLGDLVTAGSFATCLDQCARRSDCVGVQFAQKDKPTCYLYQWIGVPRQGKGAEGQMSGMVW